jgi:hypothetical protein
MARKYPEPVGPKTEYEMLAWLFGMLASAYGLLSQYERAEQAREHDRMRDVLIDRRDKKHPQDDPPFPRGANDHA